MSRSINKVMQLDNILLNNRGKLNRKNKQDIAYSSAILGLQIILLASWQLNIRPMPMLGQAKAIPSMFEVKMMNSAVHHLGHSVLSNLQKCMGLQPQS